MPKLPRPKLPAPMLANRLARGLAYAVACALAVWSFAAISAETESTAPESSPPETVTIEPLAADVGTAESAATENVNAEIVNSEPVTKETAVPEATIIETTPIETTNDELVDNSSESATMASDTSTNTPAAALPESQSALPTFSVKYTLENDFVTAGEALFRLSKKDKKYQLLLETKPTGVFRLSKKGKIREVAELPSLHPPFLSDKYTYTNFGDEQRSYSAGYDRQKGEATVVRDGNTTSIPIDTNAVDRLSMTLVMMQRLRETPDIESFSIDAIDLDGTQTFSFVSRGETQLNTSVGSFTTTRIDRQRTDSNRNTITWFASIGTDALPLPVQIEQYKSGKLTVRLKIAEFSTE